MIILGPKTVFLKLYMVFHIHTHYIHRVQILFYSYIIHRNYIHIGFKLSLTSNAVRLFMGTAGAKHSTIWLLGYIISCSFTQDIRFLLILLKYVYILAILFYFSATIASVCYISSRNAKNIWHKTSDLHLPLYLALVHTWAIPGHMALLMS